MYHRTQTSLYSGVLLPVVMHLAYQVCASVCEDLPFLLPTGLQQPSALQQFSDQG